MSVQYPYLAVICGEEHAVKGWRDGNLLTDKGEFIFNLLHGDHSIQSGRLVEVALLQLEQNGEWLLNGHNLKMLEFLPAGNRLSGIIRGVDLRLHKGEIHAVAWVQTKSAEDIIRLLDEILDSWKTASQPNKIKEMFSSPYHQAAIGLGNTISSFTVFKDWGKAVSKAECLATHLYEPRDKKMMPAKAKWGKECPICRKHDVIRDELNTLFKMK